MQTFGPGGMPCLAGFSVSGKVLKIKDAASAYNAGMNGNPKPGVFGEFVRPLK